MVHDIALRQEVLKQFARRGSILTMICQICWKIQLLPVLVSITPTQSRVQEELLELCVWILLSKSLSYQSNQFVDGIALGLKGLYHRGPFRFGLREPWPSASASSHVRTSLSVFCRTTNLTLKPTDGHDHLRIFRFQTALDKEGIPDIIRHNPINLPLDGLILTLLERVKEAYHASNELSCA